MDIFYLFSFLVSLEIQDNISVQGMFRCVGGLCTEMLDYSCERRCKDIGCDKSLIILNGDNILLGTESSNLTLRYSALSGGNFL